MDMSNPPSPETLESIRQQFEQRCIDANIPGRIAFVEGEISRIVIERALLNDLVVLNVAHPPGTRIVDRLSSGLRNIIRRCARPILAVPGKPGSFSQLLVAYDSSLKGRQALTLAAYFSRTQQSRINVICVKERATDRSGQWLRDARRYLESHGIDARYHHLRGDPGKMILQTGRSQKCTMILMGGYGFSPVVEVVVGSTVDVVLREADIPVLICQ
jgi:nucleotide-binding universal stress UspA family protein